MPWLVVIRNPYSILADFDLWFEAARMKVEFEIWRGIELGVRKERVWHE